MLREIGTNRDIARLFTFPPESAPEPVALTEGFLPDREMILLSPQGARDTEELAEHEREALLHELELAASHIEAALVAVQTHGIDTDTDLAVNQLSDALAGILAMKEHARSASPAAVMALAVTIPAMVSAAVTTTSTALGHVVVDEATIMSEISVERIELMHVSQMAEQFTAAHFAQMSEAQLDAVRRRTDAAMDSADRAGDATDAMLEASGLAGDHYRRTRDQLKAQEEEARQNEDRQALARSLYLQSVNREAELRANGMDEAADAEAARGDELRDAARLVAREEAAREAAARGMSPEQREEHIAAAEAEAMAGLDTAREELLAERAEADLTGTELVGREGDRETEWDRDQEEDTRGFGGALGLGRQSGAAAAASGMETAVAQARATGTLTRDAVPEPGQAEAEEPQAPSPAVARAPAADAGRSVA